MTRFIAKRRWGLEGGHPDKEYPPLDEKLMDETIEFLGDIALANREAAVRNISAFVAMHRHFKDGEKNPIRPSEIKSNLICIRESAKELRRFIAELDYFSLAALRKHAAFKHHSLREPIAKGQRREREFWAICERQDSRLLSMLETIVEASERALEEPPEERNYES